LRFTGVLHAGTVDISGDLIADGGRRAPLSRH
jgi:hypothetical protein